MTPHPHDGFLPVACNTARHGCHQSTHLLILLLLQLVQLLADGLPGPMTYDGGGGAASGRVEQALASDWVHCPGQAAAGLSQLALQLEGNASRHSRDTNVQYRSNNSSRLC
jgi:hypothetical protein